MKRKIEIRIVILIAILQFSNFVSGQSFTDLQSGFPTLTTASAAWTDFDNDGDLDFALTGFSGISGEIGTIYRNDGNGIFSLAYSLPFPVTSGSVSWGDYDHDGDPDLLVNGQGSGSAVTTLYRNDGNSIFNPAPTSLPGIIGVTKWIDYDEDGWLDILMSGIGNSFSSDSTRLFHNDSNGVFTEMMINVPGYFANDISIVDFDNDGDMDFFIIAGTITFSTYPVTQLYQNNGSGIFTPVPFNFMNLSMGSSAWKDNDNDGDLDLLYCGTDSTGMGNTLLYRNDGAGNFTLLNNSLPGAGEPGSVDWADIDNDGDLDILLGGPQTLLRNDGNNAYSDITPPGFQQSVPCYFADIDNDNDPDILLISQSGGSFASTIYRNDLVTSVDEINPHAFVHTYPNPVNGTLNVHLYSTAENYTIEIFNISGEQVCKSANNKTLDVASFPGGMYFLKVQQGNKKIMGSFIKQ